MSHPLGDVRRNIPPTKRQEKMKKKAMKLILLLLLMQQGAFAQEPYLTLDQMPDLIKCLPAPPAFDSPEFANDMSRFAWGKHQRLDPERARMAVGDAVWNLDMLFHQFAVPFGIEVSEKETPEIYKLLVSSLKTTDPMRKRPKAYYHRLRPFEYFGDKMLSDEDDNLRGEGSYPSGHTMRGWTCALLMAEIAPQRADTIFRRAWIYCENRVIVGAHWQSDVDVSRVAAGICYGALQGSSDFRRQMAKAQKEYAKLTRRDEK